MFKFVVIAMVFAAANAGVIHGGWSTPVVSHVATPVAVQHVATSWQNNNQVSVHPVAVKAVHAVHAVQAVHAPVAIVSSHGGWNNGGWNNGGSNGGWNNGGSNGGWSGAGNSQGGWNNGW